jgi:RND family efflux transporter MFP subunit
MASPGSPIVSIVDISQIVARANIPIADASFIHVGNPAVIAGPDGDIDAKVTVVSPAVNPATTTIEIWVQVANPGEKLKPGATMRVSIKAATLKDAVLVPASALLNGDEGGHRLIVVAANNTAQERKVTLGVKAKGQQQITDGVNEGDKVVISGGLGLEDGAKVRVAEAPAATPKEDEKK